MDELQRAGVTQSFLTQGCRVYWAEPVLEAKTVLPYFDLGLSMDFHDSNYETKKLSMRPIAEAIRRHGATPDKIVFLEDSVDNLVMSKQFDPRILTVMISPQPLPPEKEAFVDIQMPDLVTFLEYARNVFCPLDTRLVHDRSNSPPAVPSHLVPQGR
jgi:phosphoglycolate phosphatase-like HAD superfamily hydrolase